MSAAKVHFVDRLVLKEFPNTPDGKQNLKKESYIMWLFRKNSHVAKLIAVEESRLIMRRYDCDLYSFWFESVPVFTNIRHIFYNVCLGVHQLHQAGIAHLDIKPENILVDLTTKKFLLCDFGSALIFETRDCNLQSHGNIGTKEYSAPEILQCKSFNPFAADMYSLGCVLYALLTKCFIIADANGDVTLPDSVPIHWVHILRLLLGESKNRPSIEKLISIISIRIN